MSVLDHQENPALAESVAEFRVVGLTSPEMRYFLWRVYKKVTGVLGRILRFNFIVPVGLLVFLVACGKSEIQINPRPGPPIPPEESDVLIIRQEQLSVLPGEEAFTWVFKPNLPTVEKLSVIREIRILSEDADHFRFNQSEVYINPYDRNGMPIPWADLGIRRPLIEKGPGLVRINFQGSRIDKHVRMILNDPDSEEFPVYRIKLRILLTDGTQPGTPIKMILVGTFWEAAN